MKINWNEGAGNLLLPHMIKKKERERSGTSLPASSFSWYLKRNISQVIFYQLNKFNCLIAFASWDVGK